LVHAAMCACMGRWEWRLPCLGPATVLMEGSVMIIGVDMVEAAAQEHRLSRVEVERHKAQ
jgi:hypothetical protein